MRFRFTIARKIGTGFGVLILLTVIVFYLTNHTLNQSKRISDEINEIYYPSVSELEKLKILILESKTMITEWVQFQSGEDHLSKKNYADIIDRQIPHSKDKLARLSKKWIDEERNEIEQIFAELDTLVLINSDIQMLLNNFDAYDDPTNLFLSNNYLEESVAQSEEIDFMLQGLILREKNNVLNVSKEMVSSFDLLQFLVKYLGIALLILGLIVSFYTTKTIVGPVAKLRQLLLELSRGVIEKRKFKAPNDEIGEMTMAMDKLVEGLIRTKDFANALGSGNYDFPYQPLSDQDELGHDLLKMRTDLAENERILEEKVRQRTAEVVQQKEEIEQQSLEIGRLYDEVTDSIVYARRIQQAILLDENRAKEILPNSFILYKPKDIVSGDFYWLDQKNGKTYFAAADCTGHGVPGAFMSIIGYNGLDFALSQKDEPGSILNSLNQAVSKSLHQEDGEGDTKDGMDIALCAMDFKTNKIEFAGAYNPLYLIRNGEIQLTKADKFPVGSFISDAQQQFSNNELSLEKGDMIYICSDGYQDQFGGPKGKKFMVRRLKELFVEICGLEVEEQRRILDEKIEAWRGKEEQVDDILVMGLKIE